MILTSLDIVHFVLALSALLLAAHAGGYLFQRLRQPQVIGEILGGLLLGTTVLKPLLPGAYQFLFKANPATGVVMGTVYHLGLLFLMFCSGMEMRSSFRKDERRTAGFVSVIGSLVPFALSFLLLRMIDPERHIGEANSQTAFALIFATATAVTSIPVISRIMLDLKIIDTPFSRIVLAAAVIEDVILYVVISLALSLVGTRGGEEFGLASLLGISGATGIGLAYHVGVTLLFFGLSLVLGPTVFRRLDAFRFNLPRRRSPLAYSILILFLMTGMAIFLGIAPMLGAFVAGIAASGDHGAGEESREAMKHFSFAFFIPIYFAIVGLKLDLIHSFEPMFFVFFLAVACLIKIVGVYAGSLMAGETRRAALNFSVAMNARGGPGIVLASLAFDAKIINESFYVTLVMLAIVTSLLAGSWLGREVAAGRPLR